MACAAAFARALVLLAGAVAGTAGPGLAQPPGGAPDGIDVAVPYVPAAARVGADRHLRYEVHVTNVGRAPVALDTVVVRDADWGTMLAAYAGAPLAALLGRPGLGPGDQHRPVVEAGLRAVLYLDVPVPAAAPRRLTHRLVLTRQGETRAGATGGAASAAEAPASMAVEVAPVLVRRERVPVLGPPLRGGPWAAVSAPAMDRGHRRVLYAVGGRARIPGRFAVDFFRVDARGRLRPDTPDTAAEADRLDQFYGHGAEVLAVADGVVAAARDGVAAPARAADAPRVGPAEAAGNFVALDVGGGQYAIYDHLRPGLRVRVGDRVRRGQVIAALGLTGQGTAPHLHFHVADAPSPLAAEGRPFAFARYTVLGGYASIDQFGRGEPWAAAAAAATESATAPRPNAVVRFADSVARPRPRVAGR